MALSFIFFHSIEDKCHKQWEVTFDVTYADVDKVEYMEASAVLTTAFLFDLFLLRFLLLTYIHKQMKIYIMSINFITISNSSMNRS